MDGIQILFMGNTYLNRALHDWHRKNVSTNVFRWPAACQVFGWSIIAESKPCISPRVCTKSFHQAASKFLFNKTPALWAIKMTGKALYTQIIYLFLTHLWVHNRIRPLHCRIYRRKARQCLSVCRGRQSLPGYCCFSCCIRGPKTHTSIP